jgi:hypothetical protein
MTRILDNTRRSIATAVRGRFFPVALVYGMTLAVGLCIRGALLLRADTQGLAGAAQGIGAFAAGAFFDAIVATYFVLPLAVWLAVAPSRLVRSRIHRALVVAGMAAYAYLSHINI